MKLFEELARDSRYARESLRRAPGFAAGVVLTLALGIATATAALSVANRILRESLPVRDEQRVLVMWADNPTTSPAHIPLWGTQYQAFGRDARTFASVAGVDYNGAWPRALWIGDSTRAAMSVMVTANFFETLGIRPVVGRLFRVEDDLPGSAAVVVISEGYWRRVFGGDTAAVGKHIRLAEFDATIVGVVPAAFRFPSNTELWLPIGRFSRAYGTPDADSLRAYVDLVGRLKSGASTAAARGELGAFLTLEASRNPSMKAFAAGLRPAVTPLRTLIVGDVEGPLVVVTIAAMLLLVVTFVSAAGLVLVRALARERELAIRTALGASRSRLALQVSSETLLLAGLATALGLFLANAALRAFVAIAPIDLPLVDVTTINARLAASVTAASVVALAVFSLVPVLIGARDSSILRERASTGRRRASLMREGLVTFQIAIAVCALMTAGIASTSFRNLLRLDLGFRAENVALFQLSARPGVQLSHETALRSVEQIAAALRATPGVVDASPVLVKPFAGPGGWDFHYRLPGDGPGDTPGRPMLNVVPAGPHYFATLGTRLVAGRDFTEDDRLGSTPVAIVDAALAKQLWPGRDPIGQLISVTAPRGAMQRVVGVVEDTRYREFLSPRSTIYVPFRQLTMFPPTYMAARTRENAAAMIRTLEHVIATNGADWSVMLSTTFDREVAAPLATPRLNSFLLVTFAVSFVLLATVGVYGLVAAYVRTRRLDIAIRLALGADAARVRQLVLRRAAIMSIVGCTVGAAIVLLGSGLLRRVVFGVSPNDPALLAGAVLVPMLVALTACWLPARRAAATNPVIALKQSF